ncbi:MAG: hypothetical protein HOE64_17185 [Nitrospina sp.]|nr:hypothetical protein [Nitrospina sp.]
MHTRRKLKDFLPEFLGGKTWAEKTNDEFIDAMYNTKNRVKKYEKEKELKALLDMGLGGDGDQLPSRSLLEYGKDKYDQHTTADYEPEYFDEPDGEMSPAEEAYSLKMQLGLGPAKDEPEQTTLEDIADERRQNSLLAEASARSKQREYEDGNTPLNEIREYPNSGTRISMDEFNKDSAGLGQFARYKRSDDKENLSSYFSSNKTIDGNEKLITEDSSKKSSLDNPEMKKLGANLLMQAFAKTPDSPTPSIRGAGIIKGGGTPFPSLLRPKRENSRYVNKGLIT